MDFSTLPKASNLKLLDREQYMYIQEQYIIKMPPCIKGCKCTYKNICTEIQDLVSMIKLLNISLKEIKVQ